jgi:hypothetical protein
MAVEISEADDALITILKLLIGSTVIADPKRQAGMDTALSYIRDEFLKNGKKMAAALMETIRREATDPKSESGLFNLLRGPAGSQSSN